MGTPTTPSRSWCPRPEEVLWYSWGQAGGMVCTSSSPTGPGWWQSCGLCKRIKKDVSMVKNCAWWLRTIIFHAVEPYYSYSGHQRYTRFIRSSGSPMSCDHDNYVSCVRTCVSQHNCVAFLPCQMFTTESCVTFTVQQVNNAKLTGSVSPYMVHMEDFSC